MAAPRRVHGQTPAATVNGVGGRFLVPRQPPSGILPAPWRGDSAGLFGRAARDPVVPVTLSEDGMSESKPPERHHGARPAGLSLFVLGVLVLLVLAIACLNVANLTAVNAAARSREIALRLSIGAGMGRLLQLVLIESALLACAGAAAGGVFAFWSAPYVMGMINSPVTPAQRSCTTRRRANWSLTRKAGFAVSLWPMPAAGSAASRRIMSSARTA